MRSLDTSPSNDVKQALFGIPVNVEFAQWITPRSWAAVRREPGGDFFVTLNCGHPNVRSLLYSTSKRVRARALAQLVQTPVEISAQ